jgi:hypothetical protein
MDRLADLIFRPLLLIGIGFILLAVISVCTGVALGRGGPTYRAKDPKTFWWIVLIYFLGGVYFIGDFLSKLN